MTAPSLHEREHSAIDITSHDFWSRPFAQRDESFARLRAGDGLSWHAPFPSLFPMEEPGYWAVTRRADIAYVSQHPELFTSERGVALDPMPAEVQRFASFFLTMDPPQHTTYRRLISSAFTPRNVRQIEEQIQRNAVAIVDDLVGAGDIDFVADCSARLPMLTIMEMLGVPGADQPAVALAAEKLFSMSDDEYSSLEERAANTLNEIMLLSSTGAELAKFRRAHPGDDLMTGIVNAEVDGQRLTDEEIGAFLILLASAGNDTTKQTTTHAMMALVENPQQRAWLMADFDGRIGAAVEEFVRWSSPVLQFARFATRDTEINGQPVAEGDKVGLFYCSANRDEAVFDNPAGFDLSRSPNPHLGFGGGGPHFCLGNQLAKAELRNLFRELLTRLKTVEFGEPDLLHSSFVHGVKRLPAHVR
ncbi:cytochrome P450 [Mycolicibacterium vanbaalenii]|uniref:Steroid C26-monooxygenase n=1 Tax=Mycolicibacterium vanbaalenii (strain DSM 7251 / JCM 13017 / BCRC 16820 / KCTC 9966 / NRRL B-24157 / PYR-1) TaxID=350058 RepID=A1T798_MYCVP|nr:cytochrome P450 [Mycolicibacterium vanbaalenii]ABM13048.1 cytochrome P450 [Mycolicibacterium vanbaalenii PYR-1]MCV7127498.1 cytochrome P450 [Mycolicibacterium vanbaalenii PYR-1]